MVGILDYGVGNINAFLNIYKQLNIPIKVITEPAELDDVNKIILPGVGHFDYAMSKFESSGLKDPVHELVVKEKLPVIGICVGMQMMANSSEEGTLKGLGWIDAEVRRFSSGLIQNEIALPLPHMGWNDVVAHKRSPIFTGLERNSKFYFLHSYYFVCKNDEDVLATADYGAEFTCAACSNNVYGIQFHPEKSHKYGIQLLKNFAQLC